MSISEIYKVHLTSIIKSTSRFLLKRTKRTASIVNEEYNEGHWKRILDEKRWLKFSNVKDYLYDFSESAPLMCCVLKGKATLTNSDTFYRSRSAAMAALFKENFGDTKHIVELGSGAGARIFSLAAEMPDCTFHGMDISPNGVQAANEIAVHFGLQGRLTF